MKLGRRELIKGIGSAFVCLGLGVNMKAMAIVESEGNGYARTGMGGNWSDASGSPIIDDIRAANQLYYKINRTSGTTEKAFGVRDWRGEDGWRPVEYEGDNPAPLGPVRIVATVYDSEEG